MSEAKRETMSIPDAGKKYYDAGRNQAYDLARKGFIPFIKVGRLKRVPIQTMEQRYAELSAEALAKAKANAPT